jgi:hypothetical protein
MNYKTEDLLIASFVHNKRIYTCPYHLVSLVELNGF